MTISVEDVFYGMNLILLNVMIYTGLNTGFYFRLKNQRRAINSKLHLNLY
ncbi:hypothetical protein [Mucilaginibacter gossypii]